MVHYSCARDWFAKEIAIVLTGKLVEKRWKINISCKCEICREDISKPLSIKIYNELSRLKTMD
jgi:hypothetical protein